MTSKEIAELSAPELLELLSRLLEEIELRLMQAAE